MTIRWFLSVFWIFVIGMLSLAWGSWPTTRLISRATTPRGLAEMEYGWQVDSVRSLYNNYGCDGSLAEMTVKYAETESLPARLVAAIVITESNCNPAAVSKKGACGLMQIMSRIWEPTFPGDLHNPEYNMLAGTNILAGYIKRYGLREGIKHYCGTGEEADKYVEKVLRIARG